MSEKAPSEAESIARKLQEGMDEVLQAGLFHHQEGRLQEAEAIYRQVLQMMPGHPDALNLLGVIALQVGKSDAAVEFFENAIKVNATAPDYHNNLGSAHQKAGRYDEALRCFARALELNAEHVDALYNRGSTHLFKKELDEAETFLRKALEKNPGYLDAWLNLGNVHRERGAFAEAAECFRTLIRNKPDFAPAHNNLGSALKGLGLEAEAEAAYREAIRLNPDVAEPHDNLGLLLLRVNRLDEAEASIRRALEIDPRSYQAHTNLGVLLRDQQRLDEALVEYGRALEIRPDYAEAHWDRAVLWLLQGNFEDGFAEYEWRWRRQGAVGQRPEFPRPQWTGGPIEGKTIFLFAEQGLGDTLQFARFAPLLAERGARPIFGCQPALERVLRTVPGVHGVVPHDGDIPPFDCYAPLLSLPYLFGTRLESVPADVPYVKADPALVRAWAAKLDGLTGRKVGLAWRGNPKHPNDHNRSCPPRFLRPLAEVPGVSLISLQTEVLEGDAGQLPTRLDLGESLDDFADTAAVVHQLDLVISVDTALAHLAGAMALPVWLLLPYAPDWRWMLERDDSPWYPSMRLFRQRQAGDWRELIDRVTRALSSVAVGEIGPGPAPSR